MNRIAPILLLLTFAAGCDSNSGYHWSTLYREDIHSVAVPAFTTRDYHQGVELQLSDAVVKKIEEYTPYKVVDRAQADTILEGEVISVLPRTLFLNPHTATPQQELYTVTVNFTWKDLHTGKVIISRSNFQQTTTYYPTLGEDQSVASQDSVEKLATAIVHEMEASW